MKIEPDCIVDCDLEPGIISHSIELEPNPEEHSTLYLQETEIKTEPYPSTIYVDADQDVQENLIIHNELIPITTTTRLPVKKDYNLGEDGKKSGFKCDFCPKVCNYASRLRLHLRTHTGEKPFSCTMCPFTASYKKSVEIHMRSHTGEKPYACSICDFRAARKANVDDHMRIHTGEKPFACPHCPFRSAQQSAVTCHIRRHTGEKRFSCPTCSFRTAYKHIMKAHVRVHTGERPFACTMCDYRGTTKLNVKLHMRKHTGEKPYSCTMCDFKSTKRYAVKLHMRRHTGERPYACPHCDYSASQKFSLQKHMKRHTGAAPFVCEECGYRCVNEKALSVHTKQHLKQTFRCPECGLVMRGRSKFTQHLRDQHCHTDESIIQAYCMTNLIVNYDEKPIRQEKPNVEIIVEEPQPRIVMYYGCDHCDFSTTHSEIFNEHMKTHDDPKQPFTCSICGLCCMAKKDVVNHILKDHVSKKKVYVCPFCEQKYDSKTQVSAHIQEVHPFGNESIGEDVVKLEVMDDEYENDSYAGDTQGSFDSVDQVIEELPDEPQIIKNSWGKVVFKGSNGTVITKKRIIISSTTANKKQH